MLPVAILAGGVATRLGELARTIPKSLVEVAGKPFIDHQLALLRGSGVTDVVLCVGHLGQQIEAHLGDGARFGLRIQYSYDGPALIGTGGALRHALQRLGQAFLVLYGDSYLECDYAAVERAFLASGRPALLTIVRNQNQWDRSNVHYVDGQITRYSKSGQVLGMQHIDYGLSAMKAQVMDRYRDRDAFDLAAIYEDLVSSRELAVLEMTTRFYEVGTPAGLAETREYISRLQPASHARAR